MEEPDELLIQVEKALESLHHAERMFEFAGLDTLAVDSAVYQIQAAQATYLMLLKKARANAVAWDKKMLYHRLLKRR